ncbi:ribokinase [Sporomusa sp.]|uniref:ribokinase n=1 Tax=Sporomusa sp. TaxID=2078658 RepID=UPI002C486272|nr:ribokinase [Sporomusa sp.]HWR43855.1 ribokinase [Sporomusa sp.]
MNQEQTENIPVLVVGSLNMDLVATADRLPATGETVFGSEFATFPGGKGANQAVAAGKLGAKVTMVGCVGQDAFAQELITSLSENNVDTVFVRRADKSTGTALITVGASGANTIVVVPGANAYCNKEDVDKALKSFDKPGILLVQHEIPADTAQYAIQAAKEAGWTVVLNPAPARAVPEHTLAMVDIITPNETEAAIITGCQVGSPDEAITAGKKLLSLGVKAAVVTLGSQGAICIMANEIFHISSISVEAVDTTAAGDAYTGALAAALAEGWELKDSLRFAAVAAGLSVTKRGAQPALPWRREVDEYISRQEVK